MGFLDSIIDGVKSAGGWALAHSGDIASVVGTVAKVAGAIVLKEETGAEDTVTHIDQFYTNLKTATGKLGKLAKEQALTASGGNRPYDPTHTFGPAQQISDTLTGIWTSPKAIGPGGQPAIPMYQDLSKWLGTLGVPPSNTLDIAKAAAQALFVKIENNGGLSSGQLVASDLHVYQTKFSLRGSDFMLSCGHAFYPLPLGVATDDHAWHSSIYATFSPSVSHVQARRDRLAALSRATTESTESSDPYWAINAQINWPTTTIASQVAQTLVDTMNASASKPTGDDQSDKTTQKRKVTPWSILGIAQTIQVRGAINDNPSSIREAVIGAASKVLSDYYKAGNKPSSDDDSMPTGVADVRITRSQLILGKSKK